MEEALNMFRIRKSFGGKCVLQQMKKIWVPSYGEFVFKWIDITYSSAPSEWKPVYGNLEPIKGSTQDE